MIKNVKTVSAIGLAVLLIVLNGTTAAGATIEVKKGLSAELVADNLDLVLHVVAPPDDPTRLYFVRQSGEINVMVNGALLNRPFLDISDRAYRDGLEQGLLGLAFDPNFKKNKYFYVDYTDKKGDTVISRFKAKKNMNSVFMNSETVILKIDQPYPNHNGGMLMFGPDGYLYIGMGDGGAAGDPQGNGQNRKSLLGALLRISVTTLPYTIPSTNPYVKHENVGLGYPEIWAYGLRNPWKFSFDSETGDLYIADVGQADLEEINFQAASSEGGENYGWNIMEGSRFYLPGYNNKKPYVLPVYEYSHNNGCSITGGYVYRGKALPATMTGRYFFSDYCKGRIYSMKITNGVAGDIWDHTSEVGVKGRPFSSVTSFGMDADGEIYICERAGNVYKIIKK